MLSHKDLLDQIKIQKIIIIAILIKIAVAKNLSLIINLKVFLIQIYNNKINKETEKLLSTLSIPI